MSEPLYVRFSMTLTGDRAEIVRALEGIGDMLQHEVDARASRAAKAHPIRRLDPQAYTALLTEWVGFLRKTFADADLSFLIVSGPTGTPEMLSRAYGAILDDFLAAKDALAGVEAPDAYRNTDTAFRGSLTSLYNQFSAWPGTLRAAAASVKGETCELVLSADHDFAPYEKMLAQETDRLLG